MVTLDTCKKIVEKGGQQFSDDQIVKIRDFLYSLASLDYQLYQYKKHYEKESNSILPRINR